MLRRCLGMLGLICDKISSKNDNSILIHVYSTWSILSFAGRGEVGSIHPLRNSFVLSPQFIVFPNHCLCTEIASFVPFLKLYKSNPAYLFLKNNYWSERLYTGIQATAAICTCIILTTEIGFRGVCTSFTPLKKSITHLLCLTCKMWVPRNCSFVLLYNSNYFLRKT